MKNDAYTYVVEYSDKNTDNKPALYRKIVSLSDSDETETYINSDTAGYLELAPETTKEQILDFIQGNDIKTARGN